jgi:membrane associated rhomboid family serine protease
VTGLSCTECGRPICTECMTPAPVGIRCPEHSGRAQGIGRFTQAAGRAADRVDRGGIGIVTKALIGINVGVYVLELAAGGSINGTGNRLFADGALFAPSVAAGDWWRLVTAAFLHYGPLHLLLNMYSLYFAGTILEHVIGRWRFLLLYLVSGVAGSAGALVWSPNAITVGASGAIFGVFGALFVLERRGRIHSGGQIGALIVVNLLFTFALSSFISVGGHVGGLIGGFVAMLALLELRRPSWVGVGSAVGVAALSFAIAYYRVRGYA